MPPVWKSANRLTTLVHHGTVPTVGYHGGTTVVHNGGHRCANDDDDNYVYSDIVQNVVVGHVKAPLLRVLRILVKTETGKEDRTLRQTTLLSSHTAQSFQTI
ncbi:hypothetical protein CEXT_348611 [Caerostris extrusa]|uniref:Uncharacterized protein n=1 Tax=Caerostris extrusa TaxID=172846 RepID=A0AAV4YDU2_CAEEX|nr:hypothetical protein CEXT_348611 [Caerostris extrusa]